LTGVGGGSFPPVISRFLLFSSCQIGMLEGFRLLFLLFCLLPFPPCLPQQKRVWTCAGNPLLLNLPSGSGDPHPVVFLFRFLDPCFGFDAPPTQGLGRGSWEAEIARSPKPSRRPSILESFILGRFFHLYHLRLGWGTSFFHGPLFTLLVSSPQRFYPPFPFLKILR